MTSMDELFTSKWLKASDIGDARPIVTIHKVTIETMKNKAGLSERRPILWFKGKEKALVCNKTNANAVAKIANSKIIERWVGCQVQLFVAEVEAFGELTEAIRLRRPPNAETPAEEPFDAEAEAMASQFDDGDGIPF